MNNLRTNDIIIAKRRIMALSFLMNRFDGSVLKDLGLSVSQAKILFLLSSKEDEEVIQKDIDYALGITHATSSGIISRMVKKGLLDTGLSNSDHRKKVILLNDQSRTIIDDLYKSVNFFSDKLVENINDEELTFLNTILAKMLHNMK